MSVLIEPARGAESASVRSESGQGPKTWKTTTRASARKASTDHEAVERETAR